MKSKFKIFTLLLFIIIFPLIFIAFYNLISEYIHFIKEKNIKKIILFTWVLTLIVAGLILIIKEVKRIEIYNNIIEFKYIFPLLNKTYNWKDFDYFILTDEQSRYETIEVIYLIKNKKLVNVISSFNYKNFDEIKKEIALNLEFKGKLYLNIFHQLFLRLGFKQEKLP